MTVTIDPHSGFCFGVTRAIRQAEEYLQQGVLFCLGDIVHNGQEVERLERMGLQTIDYDTLRELRYGRVLFRAHGEPPSTYRIAQDNELEVIDATCPVVKKLQERIRDTYHLHPDAQIVIFGKKGHAEVIGLVGQTHNTSLVIESVQDLDRLDYSLPIYLFSQTTKSVEMFREIVAEINRRRGVLYRSEGDEMPAFEWHDTICRNVSNRVDELKAFVRDKDLVYFVGGQKSSNAKVLFAHCLEANPNTVFLSSPEEITELPAVAADAEIGICGATSTPLWLMQAVRDKLVGYSSD